MAALIDVALDDIITQRSRTRGRGGRGGRGRGGAIRRFRNTSTFRSTSAPYTRTRERQELPPLDDDGEEMWQHDMYEEEEEMEDDYYQEEEPQFSGAVTGYETGTKVKIDNLEYSVSEENLKALFEKVGTVKNVRVFYDRSGRSKGQAEVTYNRRADGISAQRKFNGIQVDGKPISVTVVGTNVPVVSSRGGRGRGRARTQVVLATRGNRTYTRRIRGSGRGSRGGRGASRGGGRGRGRKSFGAKVTTEQLDAEMEEYNASK